jgi:hypothetical protein
MASIPFEYECSKEGGFVMDPNEHKRIGYIISLNGFGLPATLSPDLTVCVPYNADAPSYKAMTLTDSTYKTEGAGADGAAGTGPKTTKVVGVISKFSWPGGVGDPLTFEFYASQRNAFQIKALQQQALKTTIIKDLAWWIADYDQEVKCWFEQSYPKPVDKITGIITGKENPALDVDLNPEVVKDGIDVNVYKITMGIAPGANLQYGLHFSNSSKMNTVKPWGLVVGTLAADALK